MLDFRLQQLKILEGSLAKQGASRQTLSSQNDKDCSNEILQTEGVSITFEYLAPGDYRAQQIPPSRLSSTCSENWKYIFDANCLCIVWKMILNQPSAEEALNHFSSCAFNVENDFESTIV